MRMWQASTTKTGGNLNLPEPQVHIAQIVVTPQPDPNVHNLKNDKAKNDEEAAED